MFSNPIRGEKRRNAMFSFGVIAQMPRHGQKLTCVPKNNITFILWITVKQRRQECERVKESWIFK